jgi:hypothetical protein
MTSQRFSFDNAASKATAQAQPSAPVALVWTFDAHKGLDKPFHGLISRFGDEVVMDLDQIVLDTPVRAAVRATRVYQHYSAQMGQADQTREVMTHMASVLKPSENLLDDVALLPPEAVFTGFSRPRG